MQIDATYPDAAAERKMLFLTTGLEDRRVHQVLTAEEVMTAQRFVPHIRWGDSVADAILQLVRSGPKLKARPRA